MKKTSPSDPTQIRRASLHRLARRDHAREELLQKLLQAGFLQEAILPVLDKLTQQGLLNDDRFVEQFIYAARQKGLGPVRIRHTLNHRGVASEIIAKHLEITDNAWSDAIGTVWRKRFRHFDGKDPKMRAKQMRFLHYRGFTQEQINQFFLELTRYDTE